MNLSKEDKELLIKVFTNYYKNEVWGTLLKEDNKKASEEDYKIRELISKLKIRDMFPDEISSRW